MNKTKGLVQKVNKKNLNLKRIQSYFLLSKLQKLISWLIIVSKKKACMYDRTLFLSSIIFYVTTIRKICFTWPKCDIIAAYNKHLVDNWDISAQTMYIRLLSLSQEYHKYMSMRPVIEGGVIFVLTHPVVVLAYFTFFKDLSILYRYVVLDK